MRTKISLSLLVFSTLSLSAQDIGTVEVLEFQESKILENVSETEVKNADVAQALHAKVPSINMIRRSAIANDITLRGQKRDNITVMVDDSKVCGACPNRMDPPTSHILTTNIENIVVSEGPFDVENFGSLSGSVKIKTKKPTQDFHGEVGTNVGSFGYKKGTLSLSGGSQKIQVLLSGSYETSHQYEDGDGNTMAQQMQNADIGTANLQDKYKDMDAFEKKTLMFKTFIQPTDKQDIEFSYTKNESDDILYPNSKMDALYDDSEILNFKYSIKDIAKFSKKLQLKAYTSNVEHPMSTKFRQSSGVDSADEVVSKLTTDMQGVKLINDTQFQDLLIRVGLDTSLRNWDGTYIGYGAKAGLTGRTSIDDVDTQNNAFFIKYDMNIKQLNFKFGTRYNHTIISTQNTVYEDRKFTSIDANMIATFTSSDEVTKYFLAFGTASRVPDARELYFNSSMNVMSGTPTLNQTQNTEIDIGLEQRYDNFYFKLKTFYSKLNDYIYFNKSNTKTILMMGVEQQVAYHSFENIDASVYGIEFNGAYDLDDDFYVDFGFAYQRGEKDEPLEGQTDTDLADMAPIKFNIALNYDYDDTLSSKIEVIHAADWDNYDEDNGEQAIESYSVVNMKVTKEFKDNLELIVGIDNIFDVTYAISNTYADLTLLSDGTTSDVMLLNEPGRYFYTSVKYKF